MIDGVDAGLSPLTIPRLTTGNHTLNVSAAGYTLTGGAGARERKPDPDDQS